MKEMGVIEDSCSAWETEKVLWYSLPNLMGVFVSVLIIEKSMI